MLAGMDVSVELWEEMGMAGVPQHPQTLTSNFLFFFFRGATFNLYQLNTDQIWDGYVNQSTDHCPDEE